MSLNKEKESWVSSGSRFSVLFCSVKMPAIKRATSLLWRKHLSTLIFPHCVTPCIPLDAAKRSATLQSNEPDRASRLRVRELEKLILVSLHNVCTQSSGRSSCRQVAIASINFALFFLSISSSPSLTHSLVPLMKYLAARSRFHSKHNTQKATVGGGTNWASGR